MISTPSGSTPASEARHRVLTGGVALGAANYLRAGLGVLTTLAIATGLGEVPFGRWAFAMAWTGVLLLVADLGLGELIAREAAARADEARLLTLGAIAWRMTILGPLGIAVLFWADRLALDPETATALRLGVPLAAAGAAYGCVAALLRSRAAFTTLASLDAASGSALLAVVFALTRTGRGVTALVAAACVVQTGQLIAALWLVWPLLRSTAPVRPGTQALGALVQRALPFAAAGAVANLQVRALPILLGYVRGAAEVGYFLAAWRLAELGRLAPQGLFGAALPVLASELQAHPHRGAALGGSLERVAIGTAIVAAAVLAASAPPLLRVTFGPAFEPAAAALVLLALGLVPMLANAARRVYLFAAGAGWPATGWSAAGLAVQLAAAVPLALTFGATGAAAAIVLGEAALWPTLRRAARQLPAELAGAAPTRRANTPQNHPVRFRR